MIGLRRRNPWLVDAMIQTGQVDHARILIRARARHGEQSLALSGLVSRSHSPTVRLCWKPSLTSQTEPWLLTAGQWSLTKAKAVSSPARKR